MNDTPKYSEMKEITMENILIALDAAAESARTFRQKSNEDCSYVYRCWLTETDNPSNAFILSLGGELDSNYMATLPWLVVNTIANMLGLDTSNKFYCQVYDNTIIEDSNVDNIFWEISSCFSTRIDHGLGDGVASDINEFSKSFR